jgi:hypothetical protein
MSLSRELLLGCLLLVVVGCSKSTPSTSTTTTVAPVNTTSPISSAPGGEASRNTVDACALLTSKDLQAIQGEALKETKPSTRADGGFMISQCLFTLPTSSNSISLLVAQKGESAGARDPKEFWQETFHRADEEAKEKEKEKDKDKDRDRAKTPGGSEEEETAPLPDKIEGVGDEAYWTGNRVGGALYALKGNIYIRVSVGGPGDQAAKIKKAKALAQIILKRL